MDREAEFAAQLWSRLSEYVKRYSVAGRAMQVAAPDALIISDKKPDIVIMEGGVPRLIIEAKRKPEERGLNPMSEAVVAQAACYALLAAESYSLDRAPMFATANRDYMVLFPSLTMEEIGQLVDREACLRPKRSSMEWRDALKNAAVKYIDIIERPLEEDSIKRLFERLEGHIQGRYSPQTFYVAFVWTWRRYVEDLAVKIEEALKDRLLNDGEYFERLDTKAKEAGYRGGLVRFMTLGGRCLEGQNREACRAISAFLRDRLAGARDLFEALGGLADKAMRDICREAGTLGRGVEAPICMGGKLRSLLSFGDLARMMAYVLSNKILAYKILELHYGQHLPPLKPLRIGERVCVDGRCFDVKTPNDLLDYLNHLFSEVPRRLGERVGLRDFRPIFSAGLYDDVMLRGVESVERVAALVELADFWKHQLPHLHGAMGYVYEDLLPPSERHQLGQFYTPPPVARLIVRWSVREQNDKVLDAGCGSGTFLIEAYKRLLFLRHNKDYDRGGYPSCGDGYNEHQDVIDRLYGIDINAFAANLAGIHLMLMEPRCPISRLNIHARDFFSTRRGADPFREVAEGFEAVVGNPPYTRWVEIPDETRKRIGEMLSGELGRYDLRADPKRGREPGIYVYWAMHAARNFLRDGGRLGLIISNMWLQTDYGVDFGRFLLDHFAVKALIDLPLKLFDALITTVIVLAEKEPDPARRDGNVVTLIRVPPRVRGQTLDATSELFSRVMRCVEDAIAPDYSLDAERLKQCREEYGIWFGQVRQGDIPKMLGGGKWICLFFDVEHILNALEGHPLMMRLGDWFEPSRSNTVWSIWALRHGKRPDLGAKDFFYFSEDKIRRWDGSYRGFAGAVRPCLAPAITRSQYVKTFTFTRADWEALKGQGKDVYIFMCGEARNRLPQQVQDYIKWGEAECRTQIRGTRGGGRPCSEAEACKARAQHGQPFSGWYDLGGYLPTPLMAIYQPRYRPQFFLAEVEKDWSLATYHAIITFIPKVRIELAGVVIDPREYRDKYPHLGLEARSESLDEVELKALLAYLNSTFTWLWLEQNARYIAQGPLGLEVDLLRRMPILNVKALKRKDVEELARLFDGLEQEARGSASGSEDEGGGDEENEEGSERGRGKLEMFRRLRARFQAIDGKIAEVLGLGVDVEQLWGAAWEMMERRISAVGGRARREEFRVDDRRGGSAPLDLWM